MPFESYTLNNCTVKHLFGVQCHIFLFLYCISLSCMLLSYFVYVIVDVHVYLLTCKKKKGIKVAVLENDFAGLSELGLPVSLCLHLQEKNLVLREALWNAKATRTGSSKVCFGLLTPLDLCQFSRRPRNVDLGGVVGSVNMIPETQNNKRRKNQLIPKHPTPVRVPLQ